MILRLSDVRRRLGVWLLGAGREAEYRSYLALQLQRTLAKRDRSPGPRVAALVDALLERAAPPRNAAVLCIGCRNTTELDYFARKGFTNVVGIDLFSSGGRIRAMDMHRMTFPAESFDIVYSAHSLEHAYDPARVVAEIVRVARPGAVAAIEVPVRYDTCEVDLVDFGGAEGLLELFGPHVGRVCFVEEQPPHSPTNDQGTPIARTVFTIKK